MASYAKLIRRLAGSTKVAAGNHQVAERIRARAEQIDPDGNFRVEDGWLVVNGLRRRVSVVVNDDPDAGRVEFGRRSDREGSDGRGGLRPLGRATRSVR